MAGSEICSCAGSYGRRRCGAWSWERSHSFLGALDGVPRHPRHDGAPAYNPGGVKAAGKRTGVPIVLNTSFNENEPVVCRPEEALDCFLRTRMDVLVMGDWLVRREA